MILGIVDVEPPKPGGQVWRLHFVAPGLKLVKFGRPGRIFAGYACDYNSHAQEFTRGQFRDWLDYTADPRYKAAHQSINRAVTETERKRRCLATD